MMCVHLKFVVPLILDLLVYSLDCVILSLALLIFLLRFIYTLCKYSHYQKSNINTLPLFWMVVFG